MVIWYSILEKFLTVLAIRLAKMPHALELAEESNWPKLASAIKKLPESIRETDEFGMTSLHWSCTDPEVPLGLLRRLLKIYPEAAAQANEGGLLPLHIAVKAKLDVHRIRLVLKAHPEALLVKNNEDSTPMDLATNGTLAPETHAYLAQKHKGMTRSQSGPSRKGSLENARARSKPKPKAEISVSKTPKSPTGRESSPRPRQRSSSKPRSSNGNGGPTAEQLLELKRSVEELRLSKAQMKEELKHTQDRLSQMKQLTNEKESELLELEEVRGEFEEARKSEPQLSVELNDLDDLMEMEMDQWMTLNYLGLALMEKGDFALAIVEFRKSIKLSEHNHDVWHNLAKAYHELEDFDRAEGALERALDIKPEAANSLSLMGKILHSRGDHKSAIQTLREALDTVRKRNDRNSS